jgi:hypothetical protein
MELVSFVSLQTSVSLFNHAVVYTVLLHPIPEAELGPPPSWGARWLMLRIEVS